METKSEREIYGKQSSGSLRGCEGVPGSSGGVSPSLEAAHTHTHTHTLATAAGSSHLSFLRLLQLFPLSVFSVSLSLSGLPSPLLLSSFRIRCHIFLSLSSRLFHSSSLSTSSLRPRLLSSSVRSTHPHLFTSPPTILTSPLSLSPPLSSPCRPLTSFPSQGVVGVLAPGRSPGATGEVFTRLEPLSGDLPSPAVTRAAQRSQPFYISE